MSDKATLESIAAIAHYGGFADLTTAEALQLVRLLTTRQCDDLGHLSQSAIKARVQAAIQQAKGSG